MSASLWRLCEVTRVLLQVFPMPYLIEPGRDARQVKPAPARPHTQRRELDLLSFCARLYPPLPSLIDNRRRRRSLLSVMWCAKLYPGESSTLVHRLGATGSRLAYTGVEHPGRVRSSLPAFVCIAVPRILTPACTTCLDEYGIPPTAARRCEL